VGLTPRIAQWASGSVKNTHPFGATRTSPTGPRRALVAATVPPPVDAARMSLLRSQPLPAKTSVRNGVVGLLRAARRMRQLAESAM
jgi:hypothetical protein